MGRSEGLNTQAILAIDQGTTSSRAIVFDAGCAILAGAQSEFPQLYPRPGWVEHDPEILWQVTLDTARRAFAEAEAKGARIIALGITNQRETALLWDRVTGKPIGNAIVWQDRRTADQCASLAAQGCEEELQRRSGLLLDPYFSASKISWMLDHWPGARALAEQGRLAFGTIDCFLLWRLSGGRLHATDATNASRTSLYNIHALDWDEELLRLFDVPAALLPEVRDSAADFGATQSGIFARPIPILALVGDQQSALIGQACFSPGAIKSTYGTGCFMLVNSGDQALASRHRLLTTIAYRLEGKPTYALEGSIFVAGASIQWLKEGLGILASAADSEAMAASLEDNGGVYLVPAFAGMGAPYWQAAARGMICGLTRGAGRAHLVRAALEACCYQTHDLLAAMQEDGIAASSLRVDGGMARNGWMMQFLADCLGLRVDRPQLREATAMGAAYLAGRQAGLYGNLAEFAALPRHEAHFTPLIGTFSRQKLLAGWRDAVKLAVAPPQAAAHHATNPFLP